jgi:hypothetical protein
MTSIGRSRRFRRVAARVAWSLAMPVLGGGCLFAPSAAELQEAGTQVSTRAIERGSQAAREQLAAVGAEERLRQVTDTYEAAVKSASDSLATMARSANDLVAVARETPSTITEAVTAQENVQLAMKNMAELATSVDRAVGVAQDNVAVLRTALVDLQADLARDDGVLNRQREALFAELRREREAIVATLQHERAAILGQIDVIGQRLADQASRKVTELADVAAPRLVDRVAERAREVASTAAWLGVLVFLVICGLPFAAGVLVGRLMRSRGRA